MDNTDEQGERQERIAEIDAKTPSPEMRARAVWVLFQQHMPDVTAWDLICFCANYLGWQSTNMMWLEFPAKHICRLVYTAHYMDEMTDTKSGIKNAVDGRVVGSPASQPDVSRSNGAGESNRKFGGFDVSGGGFE